MLRHWRIRRLRKQLEKAPAGSQERQLLAVQFAAAVFGRRPEGGDMIAMSLFAYDREMFMYSINKKRPPGPIEAIIGMMRESDDE